VEEEYVDGKVDSMKFALVFLLACVAVVATAQERAGYEESNDSLARMAQIISSAVSGVQAAMDGEGVAGTPVAQVASSLAKLVRIQRH